MINKWREFTGKSPEFLNFILKLIDKKRYQHLFTVTYGKIIFFAVPAEPVWSLDRHETGDLFWRRDSSKVKFRCEVEVLEFIKDPEENKNCWPSGRRRYQFKKHSSHPIVVVATCLCAIIITVLLPWLMIGSNVAME